VAATVTAVVAREGDARDAEDQRQGDDGTDGGAASGLGDLHPTFSS